MEQPTYLHSVQRLFGERVLELRLPEMATLSLPAAVRVGGMAADAAFVFEDISGKGRPVAWGMLDRQTGEPLFFARCAFRDILPPGGMAPDAPLTLHTPQPLTPEALAGARRELIALYEQLRFFALEPAPDTAQRETMARFAALFEMLAYVEHRPFYRALAPDFLDWLGFSAAEWPAVPQGEQGDSQTAAALRELAALFQEKIAVDTHKQRLFDEMHGELQQYKNNLVDALTRPMEGDIIKLIDDIEKSMEAYRARPFTPDSYRRIFTLFEGVATDLGDLLYRHGLESFTQEGDEVVLGRQKVLATIPTEKKALDKKVAVRHSRGWEKNGAVVRPERISVYLYTPPGQEKTL